MTTEVSVGSKRRQIKPPVCVLVSGGLDSAVLLHRLVTRHRRVLPCYLRSGFSWETTELYWVRRFLQTLRAPHLSTLVVVDAPLRSTYGAHWSITGRDVPSRMSDDQAVCLPGRNIVLLSHAALVCAQRGMTMIAVGTLRGNPFSDATLGFFSAMARVLTQGLGRPIRIVAPLRRLTKPDLIRSSRGVAWALTFSCLAPKGRRHCGRCNKCAERSRAFRTAGVPDPTRYVFNKGR